MTDGPSDRMRRAAADLIRPFVVVDRIGVLLGAVIAAVVNLVLREPGVWFIMPFLAFTAVALTFAERAARRDAVSASLWWVAVGNWVIAIAVTILFPWLWPVMAFTAIMPLMLATPYVEEATLPAWVGFTAFVGGVVAIAGVANDDGGVISDVDDAFELVVVTSALVGHVVPLALIVRQHRRLQSRVLDDAEQLNVELSESQRELERSRRRVVEAADRERRRIERDLHDGAQQRLLAAKLGAELLAETVDASAQPTAIGLAAELGGAIDELRDLAHGIYPPVLESGGLGDALSAAVRRNPTPVHLHVALAERLPATVEAALYFTALEALSNAAKHAAGADVHVRVEGAEQSVELSVTDDGEGFDLDAAPNSIGLLSMADRISTVGGTLRVDSASGRGTRVTATVPLA